MEIVYGSKKMLFRTSYATFECRYFHCFFIFVLVAVIWTIVTTPVDQIKKNPFRTFLERQRETLLRNEYSGKRQEN